MTGFNVLNQTVPFATVGTVDVSPVIWPPDTNPKITALSIGGVNIPVNTQARMDGVNSDVKLPADGEKEVVIQGTDIPSSSTVTLRIVHASGRDETVNVPFVSAAGPLSSWKTMVTLEGGVTFAQAKAELP